MNNNNNNKNDNNSNKDDKKTFVLKKNIWDNFDHLYSNDQNTSYQNTAYHEISLQTGDNPGVSKTKRDIFKYVCQL